MEKYNRRPSLNFLLNDSNIPNGSVIWNGTLKARDLADAKTKRKVGNGVDILF